MKELDLAYMAGIWDGEGCISIKKSTATYSCTLYCIFRMANQYMPDLFKSHFGGSVLVVEPLGCEGDHKRLWQWTVASRLASAFLETILPYLRLKKAEAELGIVFQGEMQQGKGRLTSEARARKEALYWQMRELKKGETNNEKTNTV